MSNDNKIITVNVEKEKLTSSYDLLWNVSKVKNSLLLRKHKDNLYYLIHYDTVIFVFDEAKNVKLVRKCSLSSNRAIKQVCLAYNMDYDTIMKNRKTFKKYKKYPMSTNVKKWFSDFVKVIN